MKFNVPTDTELVGIMLQGGYEFCSQAARKWRLPDYMPDWPEDDRGTQIMRWLYAHYRCWQLAQHLKGVLSDAPERDESDIEYAVQHYGATN